jgi:hypothetical protein
MSEVGGFGEALDFPFFGGGVSVDVGLAYAYDSTLDGMGFMLDLKNYELRHRSVPLSRAATDIKDSPGKGTLNPEAFWRRRWEDWHVGAGQTQFDGEDASQSRFRRSRGIDVWTRNQISLLPDVESRRTSSSSNLLLVVAGSYLYLINGTQIEYTQDITPGAPTWTGITGEPGTAPTVIASDGFNVLTVHGASGIYKTTRGAATTASHITGTVAHVAYGKGRWIATNGAALYDITTQVAGAGPVALPAALFTHPNSDFAWNSFAEGPTAFYVGGFSGDKSLIYRLTMKEDGTGLNQPVVAGFLPDGELIQSMQGYLGFVLIGTTKGVRVGIVGGDGGLTIGAFIPTDTTVRCFEGQERYVWFGWSNFESSTYHGLGRVNMEVFSDPDALAPAYASDLLKSGAGTVTSVVTFQDQRVWTADIGGGTPGIVYTSSTANLAATGEIDSGAVDFGLTDEKLSLYVDLTHVGAHGGEHSIYLSVDRDDFVLLATPTGEHQPVATGEARGREFEVRITLARDGVDPTTGPTLRSWAIRVQPVVPITEIIEAPLMLVAREQRVDALGVDVDPRVKAQRIRELCQSKQVVLWTRGDEAWSVIIDNYDRNVIDTYVAGRADEGENSTCLTAMKVVT